jgi:hypothetical protein
MSSPSNVTRLTPLSEQAVIEALVGAKHAVDGVADIEYVAGRRCDVQRRLEGRQ